MREFVDSFFTGHLTFLRDPAPPIVAASAVNTFQTWQLLQSPDTVSAAINVVAMCDPIRSIYLGISRVDDLLLKLDAILSHV